jgi:hypothetical protein
VLADGSPVAGDTDGRDVVAAGVTLGACALGEGTDAIGAGPHAPATRTIANASERGLTHGKTQGRAIRSG